MAGIARTESPLEQDFADLFYKETKDIENSITEARRLFQYPFGASALGGDLTEGIELPATPLFNAILLLSIDPCAPMTLCLSRRVIVPFLHSSPSFREKIGKIITFMARFENFHIASAIRHHTEYAMFAEIALRGSLYYPEGLAKLFHADVKIAIKDGDVRRLAQLFLVSYSQSDVDPQFWAEQVGDAFLEEKTLESIAVIAELYEGNQRVDFFYEIMCHVVRNYEPSTVAAEKMVQLISLPKQKTTRDGMIAIGLEMILCNNLDLDWEPLLYEARFSLVSVDSPTYLTYSSDEELPTYQQLKYMFYVAGAYGCIKLYEDIEERLTEHDQVLVAFSLHGASHMPPKPLSSSAQEILLHRAVSFGDHGVIENLITELKARAGTELAVYYDSSFLRECIAMSLEVRDGAMAGKILRLSRANTSQDWN